MNTGTDCSHYDENEPDHELVKCCPSCVFWYRDSQESCTHCLIELEKPEYTPNQLWHLKQRFREIKRLREELEDIERRFFEEIDISDLSIYGLNS